MTRSKQLQFDFFKKQDIKHFGGALLKGSHPKCKRPISIKRTMHLVLRASLARGPHSLLKHERRINAILATQAKKHGVKVYRHANSGNHLHVIVLPRSRRSFHGFIRAISGLIARGVLGAERGRAKGLKFWDHRPFTRVVEWGQDFRRTTRYLLQNTLEAYGIIPYQTRRAASAAMSRSDSNSAAAKHARGPVISTA